MSGPPELKQSMPANNRSRRPPPHEPRRELNGPLTPSLSPSDGERVRKPGDGAPVFPDAGKVMGPPPSMSLPYRSLPEALTRSSPSARANSDNPIARTHMTKKAAVR